MSRLCTLSHILYIYFFNGSATSEIYTLSLHDALPILNLSFGLRPVCGLVTAQKAPPSAMTPSPRRAARDRKSTRLNSSHTVISYAVFCLKKKKNASLGRFVGHRDRNRTVRRSADSLTD